MNLSLRHVSLELYLGEIKGIKTSLRLYLLFHALCFLLNFEITIEIIFVCYAANFVALSSFMCEDLFRMCMPS